MMVDKIIQSAEFIDAVNTSEPVNSLTHAFYKYPARFPPSFARTAIKLLTRTGDVVLDPFMGGGTTLVESRALGRIGIGVDISGLAYFVSKTKIMMFTKTDLKAVKNWALNETRNLSIHDEIIIPDEWIGRDYMVNLHFRYVWRIRKLISLFLISLTKLETNKQKAFARCAILSTSQWALDCKRCVPSVQEFREGFLAIVDKMCDSAVDFSKSVRSNNYYMRNRKVPPSILLNRSAINISCDKKLLKYGKPKLVITSPPYPGVHVLYHKWQLLGRKELSAPFWIADAHDGKGASYYTFGDRKQKKMHDYFSVLTDVYCSIRNVITPSTLIIQLISFSNTSAQLPRYLDCMTKAGLSEIKASRFPPLDDGRLWRDIPNRKWYANEKGNISSSREVVLFHRLS